MNKTEALRILATAQGGFLSKTAEGVQVPFLHGETLPVAFYAQDIDLDLAADALVKLAAVPASLRERVSELLFGAAQQSFEDCASDFKSPQHQLDWESESTGHFLEAKVPTAANEIWSLVRFESLQVAPTRGEKTGPHGVKVVGECAWDGEHGIAIVFDGDGNLAKVSGN